MAELFRLIILEDEEEIRHGLTSLIDWAALGFCVSGTFHSGEDVLEYLSSNHADALLTDICLGGLSGLDVAKRICENWPATRVVILSGYSDFKYAQQAVAYKVAKYLLKPIDFGELSDTFLTIRDELRKSNIDKEHYRYARQYCLKSLLSVMVNNGQYHNEFSWLLPGTPDQSDSSTGWLFAILRCSSPKENADELLCRLPDLSAHYSISAYYRNRYLYVLAAANKAVDANPVRFARYLETAIDQFVQQHGVILSAICMESMDGLSQLEALVDRHRPEGTAVSGQDEPLRQAMDCVNDLDFGGLLAILPSLDDDILRTAGVLLLARRSQMATHFSEMDSVDDAEYRQFQTESGAVLQEHIRRIAHSFQQYLTQATNHIVSRACMYIDSCHGRKVSLSEVAEQVFVSPTYLSRLFKSQMDINFKAYVSGQTLEAAKRILVNTDAKICDISDQLGYKDLRHFYKFFSSGTGMTPTEYRRATRG